MKYFIFFLMICTIKTTFANSCNQSPEIQSIFFTSPSTENENGQITILGEFFPDQVDETEVTLAQKNLSIISSSSNQILAEIKPTDYIQGSYRVKLNKKSCNNKYDIMDATIVAQPEANFGNVFTRRQTAPFSIFPHSYAEVDVACNPDELAISGGFIFSTWELNIVSSYPDGRFWRFKIYNNYNITSSLNEFYAICVR